MTDTCVQWLVHPVRVDTGKHFAKLGGILLVKCHLGHRIIWRIKSCQAFYLQFLCRITHVIAWQICHFKIEATSIIDTQTTLIRAFCLNDNNAIGGFRTIDSLGSGIFQRGKTFNLIHVKVEDFGEFCLKAIKNKQRLIGTGSIFALYAGNSGAATHLKVGQCVRITTRAEILYL